ncbi:MAG TPA: MFS transporter [Verrucomicrobiae bacterium]|jgi:MFS transporter, ACS family, aldohexuronate transporter|nr:MFS transporter [Verrucomicrobiae bacterium]
MDAPVSDRVADRAAGADIRWRLLAILTTSYGAGAFGMLGISPLSPSLVEGLGLTRFQVAFIVPSIYLAGLLFSLPGGRLADRLGVRPAFLGGLALGAAGLLAAALAPGFLTFLACLFVAGAGWSVVNPTLGKAIMDVFPVRERGIAMGVKQMGLTLGGLVSALVLPAIAAGLGWRYAVGACSVVVALPVALGWRPLGAFRPDGRGAGPAVAVGAVGSSWWWARRPALVVFFATGFVLGMVQAAVLSYLPLFTIQALGFDKIGAGFLVAASQAGGAVSRLALGAASDRWFTGRRSMWLAFTGAVGAVIFTVYALWAAASPLTAAVLAFATGVGAYGWVGIFFVISAEAGGPRQAGLLSGVAFAAIVLGLLVGPPVFGLLLEASNSYAVAWAVFAALSALVAVVSLVAGAAIDRESRHR